MCEVGVHQLLQLLYLLQFDISDVSEDSAWIYGSSSETSQRGNDSDRSIYLLCNVVTSNYIQNGIYLICACGLEVRTRRDLEGHSEEVRTFLLFYI